MERVYGQEDVLKDSPKKSPKKKPMPMLAGGGIPFRIREIVNPCLSPPPQQRKLVYVNRQTEVPEPSPSATQTCMNIKMRSVYQVTSFAAQK